MITITKTLRGFRIGHFIDRYLQNCSIQESSLASEPCIWLGVDNTGPLLRGQDGFTDGNVQARMHLTQDNVIDLLPLLHHFVETGCLPDGGSVSPKPEAKKWSLKRRAKLPRIWC